jgi:uncharacterized protein (TIGR03435 family)
LFLLGPNRWLIAQAATKQASATPPGNASAALQFDVASIRQNRSGPSASGGDKPRSNFPIGSDDSFTQTGGIFSATNLPVISYLIFAYKITTSNRDALIASVPDWVETDSFDIEARTDNHDVTKDQMRLMMQTLLADRYKLVAHREVRQVPVYAAVLAQPGTPGPQLRPHPADSVCPAPTPPAAAAKPPAPATDDKGFPAVCGFANYIHPTAPHLRRVGGGNVTLAAVVSSFTGLGRLGRPTIDKTDLAGTYDFVIEYLPEPPPGQQPSPDVSGPTFEEALRKQLGLKLVSQQAPIEFVIVDHIERPSPN